MSIQEQTQPRRKPSFKRRRKSRSRNRSARPADATPQAHAPNQRRPHRAAPVAIDPAALAELGAFAELGVCQKALECVARIGFRQPTEIQEKFIPAALTGRDCVGLARTGTGKTVAFLLPIFNQVFQTGTGRALVLAPTRELAVQIAEESRKLSGSQRPNVCAVYGGTSINRQIQELRQDPEIVVATPGRLLDHAQRRTIDLSTFTTVVMDEVDRMFDMGFRRDISKILKHCGSRAQTMFLSATMPNDIMRFADRFLSDPVRVSAINEDGPSVETLDQRYFAVSRHRKQTLLVEVLEREKPELCLIFTRTKRGAERLGNVLVKRGYNAMHIHGDLAQNRRQRALDQFRAHNIQLLVATDVLGRGIDVPGVSHVINYDIPENPKDYLHRVGRSGRMNAPGKAFTFVTPEQAEEITAIEITCDRLLDRDVIPGFDNGIRRQR